MKVTLLVLFSLAMSPAPLDAQDTNFDGRITYLVPLNVPKAVEGSFGTRWRTELWIHNGNSEAVNLGGCWSGQITFPGDAECREKYSHAAFTTEEAFPVEVELYSEGRSTGLLRHLRPADAPNIILSSRLFEMSRLSQPVGVEIPVVAEKDFFTKATRLIAIPNKSSLRSALRVYDPRPTVPMNVQLEALAPDGRILAARIATLIYPEPPSDIPRFPGMLLIPDLAAQFPELAGVDWFDIVVTPIEPNREFWAFVSVTDNESQQVFTVTARK